MMSSSSQPSSPARAAASIAGGATSSARGATGMRTQKVDVVASLLLAAAVVVGMFVLLLFLIWLTQTFTWTAGDIKIEEERVAGRGDHAAGFERDIEPPGAEEIEQLSEPTLAESLEAVTDAASNVAASLDAIDSRNDASVEGAGRGDSRPPGPLGEGDDVVPRFERWELKFQAKGLQPYALQLDFYGVELACIGGGVSTVDYATSLASTPRKRSGSSAEENKRARLHFLWRQEGPLQQFDQQLLEQAGVQTQGRQILKFLPKELEERLAQTEMQYAISQGHSSVKEIAKTVFESQAAAAGGYEFVVIEQRYRLRNP
ncbi:MAG: hypothetical protein KDA45_02930 [Planctomycetales bacterium]|nr:hypothetical protein [Planctomycetales bacterium]